MPFELGKIIITAQEKNRMGNSCGMYLLKPVYNMDIYKKTVAISKCLL